MPFLRHRFFFNQPLALHTRFSFNLRYYTMSWPKVVQLLAARKREENMEDSLDVLTKEIVKFTEDRNWDQFHSPANLAKSVSIEAGELLECFQWDEKNVDKQAIQEELADVMIYCFQMGIAMDFDLKKIIEEKMAKNAIKYPVSKAKGNARKYNKL